MLSLFSSRLVSCIAIIVLLFSIAGVGVIVTDSFDITDPTVNTTSSTKSTSSVESDVNMSTTTQMNNSGLGPLSVRELNDTDGDGLTDSFERKYGTNVTDPDTDDDGLSDRTELRVGTDPLVADTDDDYLSDGAEYHQYRSDPLTVDTDDDGLDDNVEVLVLNTNPNQTDTDNDTVSDYREYRYGTDPTVAQSCTKPENASDSDGDGITDYRECLYGLDPTDADTDNDALTDGEEIRGVTEEGHRIPDANPAKKDIYLVFGVSSDWTRDTARNVVGLLEHNYLENHNGRNGIAVHYEIREIPSVTYSGKYSFYTIEDRYHDRLLDGRDHYRAVVIAENRDLQYGTTPGYADAPGDFAVSIDSSYIAFHEVLHTAIGPIEDSECYDKTHVCSEPGVMSKDFSPRLSDTTEDEIEENGFEEPE